MTEEQKNPTEEMVEENATVNALESFLEHQRKALQETRKALESLIPVAFREHSSNALNEAVEGYRSFFNAMMDEVNDNIKKFRARFEKEAEEVAEKVEIEAE